MSDVKGTPGITASKQASVEERTRAKQLQHGGPELIRQMAVALENGNRPGLNPELQELASPYTGDKVEKYGAAGLLGSQRLMQELRDIRETEALDRDLPQIAGDALTGAGAGLVSGLGGMAAAGAGLADPAAGAYVAGKTQELREALQGLQSYQLQAQRGLYGERAALDQADADAAYQEAYDRGEADPGLQRFVTEALDTVERMRDLPAAGGDIVAEGAGSLAASFGVGKLAASAGVRLMLSSRGWEPARIGKFLKTAQGKELMRRQAEAGMPAVIGGLEGGGAYSAIQAEIQAMDHEALMDGSPAYRELIAAGLAPEEARNRLANSAGLKGAVAQGLAGVATGRLVAKFEANPFRAAPGRAVEALGNLGRETLEEAVQGVSESAISGEMIRRHADASRDPLSGLGQAAVEGAVGGLGAAGAVQAPQLAGSAAVAGAKAAGQGAAAAGSAVLAAAEQRSAKLADQARAEAGLDPDSLTEAAETADAQAARLAEANELLASLVPAAEEIQEVPETLRPYLTDDTGAPQGRATALTRVLDGINDPGTDADTRQNLLLFAGFQAQALEDFADSPLPDYLAELPEAEQAAVRSVQASLQKTLSDPRIQEVKQQVIAQLEAQADSPAPLPEVTEDSADSPEVRQAVQAQVQLAALRPASVDPDFIDLVLDQKIQKRLNLSERVRRDLQMAGALAREINGLETGRAGIEEFVRSRSGKGSVSRILKSRLQETPARFTRAEVADQLNRSGNAENALPSLEGHLAGISRNLKSGNVQEAQIRLDRLGEFVRHMHNKLQAASRSLDLPPGKNKVGYDTLTPYGWAKAGEKGAKQVYVTASSPESLATGQAIALDAEAATRLYNNLLRINAGVLTGTAQSLPEVPAALAPAAEPVAEPVPEPPQEPLVLTREQRVDLPAEPDAEAEPQPEPEPEPEPEAETEAEDPDAAAREAFAAAGEAAAPDAAVAEAPEAAEAEPRDLSNLVQVNGERLFETAFTVNADSPLHWLLQPLQEFTGWIASPETVRAAAENPLAYAVRQEDLDRLARFAGALAPALQDKMNERLRTVKVDSGTGYTMAEALENGKELAGFKDRRVGNLMDAETRAYDAQLLELGVLAAAQWLLAAPAGQTPLSRERAARILGLPETAITPEILKEMNAGIYARDGVEALASLVQRFWGVQANGSVSESLPRGIAEGFAAELVMALQDPDLGVLEVRRLPLPGVKKPNMLVLADSAVAAAKEAAAVKHLISDLMQAPLEQDYSIGVPPESTPRTQHRNSQVALSQEEQALAEKAQAVPSFLNLPFASLVQALSFDTLDRLMGSQADRTKPLNTAHLASLDGKRETLAQGWNALGGYWREIRAYAEAAAVPMDQVPVFFRRGVNKLTRLQMQGVSPQSHKLIRAALTPTRAVLDLAGSAADRSRFWLAVAQGLDGFKVEHTAREEIEARTRELIAEKYPRSLEILTEWAAGSAEEMLAPEQQAGLVQEIGKDGSAALLHALLNVARLQSGSADPAAFATYLPFEADGVTNGPVNALVNYRTGEFSEADLELFEKGGLALNAEDLPLARIRENRIGRDGSAPDLYETAAKLFGRSLSRRLKDSLGREDEPVARAVYKITEALGQVTAENGQLVVGRKTLKNPLTITIYGSGPRGIAEKLAAELSDTLAELASELLDTGEVQALQGHPEFFRHLADAVSLELGQDGKGRFFTQARPGLNQLGFRRDPQNFALSQAQKAVLANNLHKIFVTPMVEAIDTILGSAKTTSQEIQKTTQIQSALARAYFDQLAAEEKTRMIAAGELGKGQALPRDTRKALLEKALVFGAVIETGNQTLNLNAAEKGDSSERFDRSLDGELDRQARMPQLKEAGVSAAPNLNIAVGDARMISRFILAPEVKDRFLEVFDGIEMAADLIEELSVEANKAAASVWLENPVQDVADSYAEFLRRKPFATVKPEYAGQVSAELFPHAREPLSWQALESLAENQNVQIASAARDAQARTNVLAGLTFSADQMAGAAAPYTHRGGPLIDGALLPELNRRYRDELARLAPQDTAVASPDPGLAERLQAYGTPVEGHEAVQLDSRSLQAVLNAPGLLSPAQQSVYRIIRKLVPEDLQVFAGSARELTRLRNALTPERRGDAAIGLGQIDLKSGMLYLANASGETLLHELLHAVSAGVLRDHYAGKALPEPQAAAADRLAALMEEFLDLDLSREDPGTAAAARQAQSQISNLLAKGSVEHLAGALSEFISWSLSNENLIKTLQKTKVRNPLARIAIKALQGLRSLFGLPNAKMFENIRFNAEILLGQGLPDKDSTTPGLLLDQQDPQAAGLLEAYQQKIREFLRERPAWNQVMLQQAAAEAARATDQQMLAGLDLEPQAAALHQILQTVFAADLEMNPDALVRAQQIYSHAVEHLVPSNLLEHPERQDPGEYLAAQEKLNLITGKSGITLDSKGRSQLLASFLSLAQSDPALRRALEQLPAPKGTFSGGETLDAHLRNFGRAAMDRLSTALAKEGRGSQSSAAALDNLARTLAAAEKDQRSWAELQSQSLLGAADHRGSALLRITGEKLSQGSEAIARKFRSASPAAARLASLGKIIGMALDKEKAGAAAEAALSLLDRGDGWKLVKEPLIEAIGMVDSNKGVLQLVNLVKYAVSSVREDYREQVPEFLSREFSRKLSESEWSALHKGLGQADLAAEAENRSVVNVLNLLADGKTLQARITALETRLQQLDPKRAKAYLEEIRKLARYRATGEAATGLLRNSRAIGDLALPGSGPASAEAVDLIARLTALEAVSRLDGSTKELLAGLVREEADGMAFALSYLRAVRSGEQAKAARQEGMAKYNHWEGHIPAEIRNGARLMVAEDRRRSELEALGYVRLQAYRGQGSSRPRSYFLSPVAGNAQYQQGALQTVQLSVNGVDPYSGRTLGAGTAGYISGPRAKLLETRLRQGLKEPAEVLLPVFNAEGQIVAFEESVAPEVMARLPRSTHFGKMLGAWAGRQAEEDIAQGYNAELVKRTRAQWAALPEDRRREEFVNAADPGMAERDPVLAESWSLVPKETKELIAETFGQEDFFPVRRHLVNNTLGYRMPSVADAWSGQSRLDPETRRVIRDLTTAVLGRRAYRILVTAERGTQSLVSLVKNNIVIRSVIVPASNMASNVVQLMNRGVPLRRIAKKAPEKLVEINQFLTHERERIRLETRLARHRGDSQMESRIQAQLQALEDSNRRMTIWPLIAAGEFSTISEGLTEADMALDGGRWGDYVENLVEKVPPGLRTTAKYAVIAKDTALFQGLSRAVQYGDFLAKAVLYDHMVRIQGKSREAALDQVSKEYINYNLLAGRGRSYAESIGLQWFWNFKIRSMKIGLQMVRDNPARALLLGLVSPLVPDVPGVSVGTPVSDNMAVVAADGRLPYSMGPGMIGGGLTLNPWVNLLH